jgi:hypothetical protein
MGEELLAQAGCSAQKPASLEVMISSSGSGQMQPLPMHAGKLEAVARRHDVDGIVAAVHSRHQQQLAEYGTAFQRFMGPRRLGERQSGVNAWMELAGG